jgi:hypothetical protein
MRIRWLQEARLEAAKSAHYYQAKDPELGPIFTAEIRERLAFVKQFPETGFRLPRTKDIHVRRVLVDRFKYAIVFALFQGGIVVVAVHHQHRRPGYWKPRLASVRR